MGRLFLLCGRSRGMAMLFLRHRRRIIQPCFIPTEDQIVSKAYMMRVEGDKHPVTQLSVGHNSKILCPLPVTMLKHSIRLLLHYLKFADFSVS
ncbi:hypothetical protein JOY44_11785 [Phormidium sp. CLA17]|uniref:hypothetical protein n=1 Tax=Leptolyngbya sp. Cla-17 TaxID=2803751 RepID=UPI001491DB31|nr:hypothetical protein [Leptolyngbya sp. Cla-17]MBM0742292.1 hypothetical protein [Leptolyngbya sp. Cla-17]